MALVRTLPFVFLALGCGPAGEGTLSTSATTGSGGSSSSAEATSATASTASSGGGPGVDLRIAVLSDLNGSYGSTSYESTVHDGVAAVIESLDPAIVLITGDMVAGQQAGLDYAAMWSAFHAAVTEPLRAAGIPLAVTPGNHDASGYSAFAAERAIFVEQWSDPARIPPVRFVDDSDYPLRYSFTHGGVFFLSLDATTIGPLDEEERAWVDAQLAQAADYPVKIAFGHIPIHAVTQGRETETLHDSALEAIFRDRGVTMYVSGHHHGYYPGARDGLRLVSTSCLGAGPRALIGEDSPSPKSLLRIEVVDGSIASLEALMAPAFDQIIDRATLPTELEYRGDVVIRDDLAGF